MIHVKPLPLSLVVDKLNRHEPISLVRYGDGEISAILGKTGETCDGQAYTPELGADLLRTLAQPKGYYYCLGPRAATGLGIDVEQFMRRRGLHVDWYDSELFINASLAGHLGPFVEALRARRVLTVGPEHLRDHPAYSAVGYVPVPGKNAYRERRRVYLEILVQSLEADVICLSSGPLAKILIYDLFSALGATHSLLDLGSVFDLYAGVPSRRYMRAMPPERLAELKRVNLGVE